MCKYLEEKISIENVATYYKFAETFKLANFIKVTIRYISRWFTMISETENFLMLDFNLISKILACSDLFITSELEVFKVVRAWISLESIERNKYTGDLLLKVRLPLLPENALEYIKSFDEIKGCSDLINDVLDHNRNFFQRKSPCYFTPRYCSQNMFNILLCYGAEWNEEGDVEDPREDEVNILSTNINQIDVRNLNDFKVIGSMPKNRYYRNIVFCRGELYFFFGCDAKGDCVRSVEKYSLFTNTSEVLTEVYDDRYQNCVCNFMDEIYIIGGLNTEDHITNLCEKFDPKEQKCIEIANMRINRSHAACAVFNGKVVVTGGLGSDFRDLRSVEVYDHLDDTWSYMPNMISTRSDHGSVAIRNKLFVVGGWQRRCEVFDKTCNSFVAVNNKRGFNLRGIELRSKTFLVGNKLFVFYERRKTALCYDIDNDDWTEEVCEITKDFGFFGCVKVPVSNLFIN